MIRISKRDEINNRKIYGEHFFVDPAGKLLYPLPNNQHFNAIPEEYRKRAIEKHGEDEWQSDDAILEMRKDGYVDGIWINKKGLFIVPINDESAIRALKALPIEWLFVPVLLVGDKEIPVIEGEDAIKAWEHRNSIRHRANTKFAHEDLIAYHGTNSEFNDFGLEYRELGFHFAGDIEQAKARGKRIIKARLKIKNPYDIVSDLGQWDDMGMLREYLSTPNEGPFTDTEFNAFNNVADVREGLKAKGYDGLVYQNSFEGSGGKAYIVFDPEQIEIIERKVVAFVKSSSSREDLKNDLKQFVENESDKEDWSYCGDVASHVAAFLVSRGYKDAWVPPTNGHKLVVLNNDSLIVDLRSKSGKLEIKIMPADYSKTDKDYEFVPWEQYKKASIKLSHRNVTSSFDTEGFILPNGKILDELVLEHTAFLEAIEDKENDNYKSVMKMLKLQGIKVKDLENAIQYRAYSYENVLVIRENDPYKTKMAIEALERHYKISIKDEFATLATGINDIDLDPNGESTYKQWEDEYRRQKTKLVASIKLSQRDDMSQIDFKKGDMVEITKDIIYQNNSIKAGQKGLIQWVGDKIYMVIISPNNEYSVSKEGKKYIKDGIKIYAKPEDLKFTHMENNWKPRLKQENETVGDWDDKQPNESWEEFNARMRASRRRRNPEWGRKW